MRRSPRNTQAQIIQQLEDWIAQHGGSLAGYVERYGSADSPDHYGDGGEAIYKADTDALARLRGKGRRQSRNASREEQHGRYIDCGPSAWDDR